MGLDFLQTLIAGILDKFKLSNPVFFTVVAALLTAVQYFVQSGVIPVDPTVSGWILWAVAIVLNAGTFKFRKSE